MDMDYREARQYLEDANKYGSVLGLDNIQELLKRLDHPENACKYVHIAGTNGKGSVLAYVSTVLTCAGYKVGRYISPTLFKYRERIQVNEEYITREALARLVTQIAEVIGEMTGEGRPHPTPFEIETALAFMYFKEMECDFVVLEVGLGGLEDATNVIQTTLVEVMTSISMDHMAFLGNTLAEIAANKAGIIKPNTVVVTDWQQPEAMAVIEEKCRKENCVLRTARKESAYGVTSGYEEQIFSYKCQERVYENLVIRLAGNYQIENAIVALETVDALKDLGYDIPEEKIREGMMTTHWRGRFTILQKDPIVIIDGAHNEDAARTLRESLTMYFPEKKMHFIMGMFEDKECEKVIKRTASLAEDIITIQTPGNVRALPAEDLAVLVRKYNPKAEAMSSIKAAVRESFRRADKDDVIVAFGSLSFLGSVVRAVEAVEYE
jgi:dihydrofolate synthase/folylpolyglutamate synthase